MDRIECGQGVVCADVTDLMSAYADGELTSASAEIVTAHMAGCRSCAALFDRHVQTERLLNLSEADTWTPPDLRLRIVHAAAHESRSARRSLWPAGLLAAAAIVAMVAVFTLGAGPAGWTATPAATPATAVPSAVKTQPLGPGSCPKLYGRALARCLGVSPIWLPYILADERYEGKAAIKQIGPEIRSPLPVERHAQTATLAGVVAKGVVPGVPTNRRPGGLIPM